MIAINKSLKEGLMFNYVLIQVSGSQRRRIVFFVHLNYIKSWLRKRSKKFDFEARRSKKKAAAI